MKIKYIIIFLLLLITTSFVFTSCFKNLTRETVIYQNNFENENNDSSFKIYGGGDSIKSAINFNGSKVLGSFNNTRVEFKLDSLPSHYAVRLEFDLNIHDQWRNDLWKYAIDDETQLLTGFSNDSSVMQSYPNWLNNGSVLSPAGANAYNRNLPGLCSWASKPNGTSVYKIINTYLHSRSSFSLSMSDANSYPNDTCRLSWSIDNFKITILNN